MATIQLPPPVPQNQIGENKIWRDWFTAVRAWVIGGATGTFKTADSPAKTVTVVNGIITSIQ